MLRPNCSTSRMCASRSWAGGGLCACAAATILWGIGEKGRYVVGDGRSMRCWRPRRRSGSRRSHGVDLNRLVLNVTGWNKLVLLDFDRVFLFPRSAIGVEWFERELAAYQALAKTRLGIVPRLLGCWEDPEIYPFPFAAVTRLRGEVPAEPEVLIEQLGRAIACWHELKPPALAGARPPRHHHAAMIAGCGGLWTRLPAPARLLRRRIFWAGPTSPVWADLLATPPSSLVS